MCDRWLSWACSRASREILTILEIPLARNTLGLLPKYNTHNLLFSKILDKCISPQEHLKTIHPRETQTTSSLSFFLSPQSVACYRLRDSRARGIESANKEKKNREETGHFRAPYTFASSHYPRAWNRPDTNMTRRMHFPN